MDEPLENAYFNWLCAKVDKHEIPTPSLTHLTLLRTLHSTEFVWLLTGDDNRAQDGVDLRHRFLLETNFEASSNWENLGCSVLEMLIAFGERAEFQTDISARDWFWTFLDNLGLADCDDASRCSGEEINDILQRFVWRTYEPNGEGGLFPMRRPEHNQRDVEIWYQFCEYLVDTELI